VAYAAPAGKGGQAPGKGQAPGRGQAPGKGQAPGGKGKTGGEEGPDEAYLQDGRAILTVNLPADAKLAIDQTPTVSTSEVRKFQTPVLADGKEYYYTLTAEIVRDGQKLTTSQRVAVSSGRETAVSLQFPTATVASR